MISGFTEATIKNNRAVMKNPSFVKTPIFDFEIVV